MNTELQDLPRNKDGNIVINNVIARGKMTNKQQSTRGKTPNKSQRKKLNKADLEYIKILCPYCEAPYTAQMEVDLYVGGGGCDTCGWGADGSSATVDIHCENCQKLVYRKEY